MNIRMRSLPSGWYPGTASKTKTAIEHMLISVKSMYNNAVAGIVPHAGWEFSGKITLKVLKSLIHGIDTIVVVGGHLHKDEGVLGAYEEGYETPLGIVKADLELLQAVKESIAVKEDRYADNTVEIQLPFIKYLFPDVNVLALRAAPSETSMLLGKTLAVSSEKLKKRITVIGSTDLTHYGPNYGYLPKGTGETALKWAMEVNDRGFLDNLLAFNGEAALDHANENHSACSAGGAVTALSYAMAKGSKRGVLLDHYSSNKIYSGESFVGYAGLVYLV